MNRTSTLRRTSGLAAVALTLSMGMAACSSGDMSGSDSSEGSGSGDTSSQESGSDMESQSPSDSGSEASAAGTGTFGPGCSAIPKSGKGSFDGMATAPVATAASANPLLKTLVQAVTQANLVDALNSAEELTVFAPTDDAFAKIPAKDMKAVMSDKKMLTKILTHHVIPKKLSPEELAGKHETLAKDTLTVKGSGEDFTADTEEKAQVICGNIQTANATVYVVDTVMMPQM